MIKELVAFLRKNRDRFVQRVTVQHTDVDPSLGPRLEQQDIDIIDFDEFSDELTPTDPGRYRPRAHDRDYVTCSARVPVEGHELIRIRNGLQHYVLADPSEKIDEGNFVELFVPGFVNEGLVIKVTEVRCVVPGGSFILSFEETYVGK